MHQDGGQDREAGDLLKVIAVLRGIWQQSKQEIHMMLRHNVLQALSHAVAVPDLSYCLDRLSASCLLTDVRLRLPSFLLPFFCSPFPLFFSISSLRKRPPPAASQCAPFPLLFLFSSPLFNRFLFPVLPFSSPV